MPINRRHALGALGSAAVLGRLAAGQDLPAMPSPLLPGPATAPPTPPPLVVMPAPAAVPVPPIPAVSGGCVRGRMSGAQAVVAALQVHRVPCVFGVPGAQNNELWDAMKSQGQAYMLVTNEYAASIMADASSRATGAVGVCMLVPGPGLTNAMTGIGEALYDSVPMVVLATDVRRDPLAPVGQVHGLPNAAILRPLCKGVIEVRHPGQIAAAIGQAFHLALAGEPGPVAVVIPYDLYNQVWDYDEPAPAGPALCCDDQAYRLARDLLADRRYRVGIYAGLGCMDATAELVRVAELLQAPVATSVSGKGAFPENHPLSVGWGYAAQGTRAAERTFLHDVDLVLAVGVRFSENSTANYALPRDMPLVHVDANPANLGRNLPADVAVCADSRVFLSRLVADEAYLRREPRPALHQAIRDRKELDRVSYQSPQIHDAVDPMLLCHTLGRALGPQGRLLVDVTASVHWAAEGVEVAAARRFFTPANNQAMGWAVPAAVGVQRMNPTWPVAAIVGDGCFLMTGLEASTAARMALPVKYFVLDDGAYHYMQMLQEPTYGRTIATEIARIDFQAMAQALGLRYNCIACNRDLDTGIRRALCTPGPVLTRVVASYHGRDIRWLEALKSQYIDTLDNGQKLRMASRLATRRANPLLESD